MPRDPKKLLDSLLAEMDQPPKATKKVQKASIIAMQAELTRCRYLIRNLKFLRDLRRLREASKKSPFKKIAKAVRERVYKKWRSPLIAIDFVRMPQVGTPECTKFLDDQTREYFLKRGLFVEFNPVEIRSITVLDGPYLELRLRLDRTHPVSELLPLIEQELNLIDLMKNSAIAISDRSEALG